jgi:glycopeptide antibiotics resistance protein
MKVASLAASIALVVFAVFPWGDFQGHTHWARVAWIPFVSPPVRLSDIIANALLFMPLGAAVASTVPLTRSAVLVASLGGGALSIVGEAAQLYSHSRFPSATDVVCNAAGASLAAYLVRRSRHRS